MDDIRTLALSIIGLPKSVVIAPLNEPPSILVATSEDSGADAGKLVKEALGAVGGRGGGSPRIAQGSVPTIDALERVVEQIVSRVG